MYSRILVTLENSPADVAILTHIRELAKTLDAAVILIHVADGGTAGNAQSLTQRESEEMRDDRAYLAQCCAQFETAGVNSDAVLASGDPSEQIVAAAEREKVDLIAMGTHGHRFMNDLVRGSVANEVRQRSRIPVLQVRAS